ncbi:MAG: phytanoyl-CoA dioxygenase family protein [Acidimicrobiales bacterium]
MSTTSRRRDFRDEGFVVIDEPLVDDRQLDRLRRTFAHVFATPPAAPPWLTKTIRDPSHPDQGVREVMFPMAVRSSLYWGREPLRSMRAVAADLLGGPVRLVFEHAIYRPAHCPARTSWHQDSVYFDPDVDGTNPVRAHLWMPLVDAGPTSGGMRYVVGSHKQALVHHDRGEHLVVDDDFPDDIVADPSVPAGGCTIHDPQLVHGANGNDGESDRVAWILHFEVDHRPLAVRRAVEARTITERRGRVLAWRARNRTDR